VTELGFWKLATADPDRMALVDPEGNEHTAGELLAAANQVSHGLRAQGLETGDTVACVLPNGLEMIELYLGAMQIGLDPRSRTSSTTATPRSSSATTGSPTRSPRP